MTARARRRSASPHRTAARRARALGASSFAALLVAVALLAARTAEACSCMMPGPPEAALKNAVAVFVANIDEVEQRGRVRRATARVVRAWKGARAGALVELRTPAHSAACGVDVRAGEPWLVYATGREDGALLVTLCSRTAHLTLAQADIAALDAAARAGSGAAQSSHSGARAADGGADLAAEEPGADAAAAKSPDEDAGAAATARAAEEGGASPPAERNAGAARAPAEAPAPAPPAALPKGSSGCACGAAGGPPLAPALGAALGIGPLAMLLRRRSRPRRAR